MVEGVHANIGAIENMGEACARFSSATLDRLLDVASELRRVTEALEEHSDELRREISRLKEEIDSADEDDDTSWASNRLEDAREERASVQRRRRRLDEAGAAYMALARQAEHLSTAHTLKAREYLRDTADDLKAYFAKQTDIVYPGVFPTNGVETNPSQAATLHENKLSAALTAHEEILAKRVGTEKLIALDAQGNLALERIGNQNSVEVFETDKEFLQDAVLTHNHPMGRSFSAEDLRVAAHFDLKELRAVGVAQPYTYSLKRPPSGWPTDMDARHRDIMKEVYRDLIATVNRGETSLEIADQVFAHEAMSRLAAELSLTYERTTRAQII